jgi:4-hydroxy-tetrahydrodipicolinate reductase
MTKIGITGASGRMGQSLISVIENTQGLELSGSVDKGDDLEAFFKASDVVIDFTIPDATMTHVDMAVQTGTALVIGTTGLSEDQEAILHGSAGKTPILYAANMSVGVNMLIALVEQTASRLGIDWDIEIFETHHHHKIDSPSGTALALGKGAQNGRSKTIKGGGEFVTNREGKRQAGDIGYAVQRGGDVVGEHDVTFFGEGERITLGHKATDRALFAKGAVRAATWIKDKPAGLYSMRDVLEL